MTKEIWVSPLPTQLKDATFLFEKSLSAAQKNDCNAITNQKMLLARLLCALYPDTCLSVFDYWKPPIVSHENDMVRLKSFPWARDCAQNREKLRHSVECLHYSPQSTCHVMDAMHFEKLKYSRKSWGGAEGSYVGHFDRSLAEIDGASLGLLNRWQLSTAHLRGAQLVQFVKACVI